MTIGAASPLWFLFAGAAATGAAFWWMSQWVKPVNLEAIMGQAEKAAAPLVEAPAPEGQVESPVIEESEELQALVEPAFSAPALETTTEEVVEAVVETATAPVEAVAEAAQEVLAVAEPATPTPAPKAKSKAKAAVPPEA
jgi:hypothetical protein